MAAEAGHNNEIIIFPVDSAEVEGGVVFQHRDGASFFADCHHILIR